MSAARHPALAQVLLWVVPALWSTNYLIARAADVMLKERRTLIVVPRETPLSTLHLENLTTVSRYGALVLPAMPSFYAGERSLEGAIDTVIARVLDHLGLPHEVGRRWGDGAQAESRRP